MKCFADVSFSLSQHFHQKLEEALQRSVKRIEGERELSPEEIAKHGERIYFQANGSEEFRWKGFPVVRVKKRKPEWWGFEIVELSPIS